MAETEAVPVLESIQETRVILAEGPDTKYFLMWVCAAFKSEKIEIFHVGGNQNLRKYLKTFVVTPGFEQVQTLVVARDAETDAQGAVKSVADALAAFDLPRPTEPFRFAPGRVDQPRTAVMIFPGYASSGKPRELANGMLEDLCLATIQPTDTALACVEEYINCLQSGPGSPKNLSKARLHAYLAGKDAFVGMKLGEATKSKAWDFDHESLAPFRETILAM